MSRTKGPDRAAAAALTAAPMARAALVPRVPLMMLSAIVALLAGCGTNPQRLTLRDSSSRDADAIVTVRPAAWGRRGGPARGFEAGYQQYRAEGTQDLATGETLSVRGTTLTGPDVLLQQAKVVTWHFGFTDRFYFGPAFELDLGVGGMKADMDYELRPQSGVVGTQPFARSYTLPYGAITPRYRFGPYVALEARLVAAGLTDDAEHRRYDGALVLSPVPQVSLRLGYSHRRTRIVVYSDPVFSSVDVTVRGQGPSASLRIDF
ncbi:MAG: hypothetical protein HZC37_14700 [Burkholderiales bacterium]|nr:hypothetical protein [Burkholderiales bacterium]